MDTDEGAQAGVDILLNDMFENYIKYVNDIEKCYVQDQQRYHSLR